jgi:hypothetical protein
MQKNKPWLIDAHCDAFEMRNFLGHNLSLDENLWGQVVTIDK